MDQSAFRQLLSAENDDKGNARIGGIHQQQSKREFGKNQKRKSNANDFRSGENGDNFIPRKLGKKKTSIEQDDQEEESEQNKLKKLYAKNYTDRSAAGRSGDGSGSHDMNGTRQNYSRLSQDNNDEVQKVSLAGDAEQTVLVKGLDYTLLEQQRAKMNGDDDLETAFQSIHSKSEPKKRVIVGEGHVKHDKFKPIGSKSKEEEKPEYIWRDGKRMRKKRKDGGISKAKEERDKSDIIDEKSNQNRISVDINPTQPKKARESRRSIDDPKHTEQAIQQYDMGTEKKKISPPINSMNQGASQNTAECGSEERSALITNEKVETHDEKQITSDEEDEDIFEGAGRWEGFGNEGSDEEGAE